MPLDNLETPGFEYALTQTHIPFEQTLRISRSSSRIYVRPTVAARLIRPSQTQTYFPWLFDFRFHSVHIAWL